MATLQGQTTGEAATGDYWETQWLRNDADRQEQAATARTKVELRVEQLTKEGLKSRQLGLISWTIEFILGRIKLVDPETVPRRYSKQ